MQAYKGCPPPTSLEVSSSTGCCFIRLHNISFEILSRERILRNFLRKMLVKTCISLMVVTVFLRISVPLDDYWVDDVLKSLIFVVMPIALYPRI
ncbi:hypothetical protein DPMN_108945 [Dreissena polymorpha]|uniref:Transmembrane protein n=1 Tax=Dreissena polymorpha TaxID=45954 RepID=A0A9D4QLG9_DREPO|nr:hypothetical protein DPMN_108945 [Dreissena polymorpha]